MKPSVPLEQLPRLLAELPERLKTAVRTTASEIEVLAVSGMRKGLNEGVSPDGMPFAPLTFPRPQGGNKPLRNRGLLGASISASVTESELILRANAPGARLHHEGGTIVPVRAKALAIPITVEAVRAGSPRNFPRKLFVPGSRTCPRGKGVLAEADGKGGLKVHYLLRMSATIPKRPYLGVSQKILDRIADVVSLELAKIVLGS